MRPGGALGIQPWQRGGNWLLTRLSNLVTGFDLTDMETGYKVLRRSLLSNLILREERFGIEPEVVLTVARELAAVVELGVQVAAVVGGAGRIGTSLCRALSAAGADVCILDVDLEAAGHRPFGDDVQVPSAASGVHRARVSFLVVTQKAHQITLDSLMSHGMR